MKKKILLHLLHRLLFPLKSKSHLHLAAHVTLDSELGTSFFFLPCPSVGCADAIPLSGSMSDLVGRMYPEIFFELLDSLDIDGNPQGLEQRMGLLEVGRWRPRGPLGVGGQEEVGATCLESRLESSQGLEGLQRNASLPFQWHLGPARSVQGPDARSRPPPNN